MHHTIGIVLSAIGVFLLLGSFAIPQALTGSVYDGYYTQNGVTVVFTCVDYGTALNYIQTYPPGGLSADANCPGYTSTTITSTTTTTSTPVTTSTTSASTSSTTTGSVTTVTSTTIVTSSGLATTKTLTVTATSVTPSNTGSASTMRLLGGFFLVGGLVFYKVGGKLEGE